MGEVRSITHKVYLYACIPGIMITFQMPVIMMKTSGGLVLTVSVRCG